MTAFETDRLLFEGEHWGLRTDPLGPWLAARGYRPTMRSTANWRGYVASWEVVGDEFRLVALEGNAEIDGELIPYDGLVGLPVDPVSGVGMHGLLWRTDQPPDVPTPEVSPPWCFDASDRLAVLIAGGQDQIGPSDRLVVDGRVLEPAGARWRHATTPDAIWSARISVPDGVEPVDEAWYATTGDRGMAFVRRPVEPGDGRRWYRASDLRITVSERRTLVIDDLFGRPAPIVADWYSGSLYAVGGQLLQYVHMGYESRFEKTLFVDVVDGRVVGHRVVREADLPPTPPTPPTPRPAPPARSRWWQRWRSASR